MDITGTIHGLNKQPHANPSKRGNLGQPVIFGQDKFQWGHLIFKFHAPSQETPEVLLCAPGD